VLLGLIFIRQPRLQQVRSPQALVLLRRDYLLLLVGYYYPLLFPQQKGKRLRLLYVLICNNTLKARRPCQ
jgi:hypothetical protein